MDPGLSHPCPEVAALHALYVLQNPSFWSVSGLELQNSGVGIVADYRAGFSGNVLGNQSLSFSDLLVHGIAGITTGVAGGGGVSPDCS